MSPSASPVISVRSARPSDAASWLRLRHAAHRALGFTEVGLVRCFRKDP